MADLESRRSWLFILAFGVIAVFNIAEGVDEGFTFWDWFVLGVCAAGILQSVSRLTSGR